jgi:hypothetical protein
MIDGTTFLKVIEHGYDSSVVHRNFFFLFLREKEDTKFYHFLLTLLSFALIIQPPLLTY